MNIELIPAEWRRALTSAISADSFLQLQQYVEIQRASEIVFPPEDEVFEALRQTPLDRVRAVILGQDPYHDEGQAHGLSFSVRKGVKLPPSLRNIYKELESDLGIPQADHGYLAKWAQQGVLLLNTVLTVRAHEAHSHRKRGWEQFTQRIIEVVNQRPAVAFVLWGKPAQTRECLIDERHLIVRSPHPSPLSARRGFFGSRPFSRINEFLAERGEPQIDWNLTSPDEQAGWSDRG